MLLLILCWMLKLLLKMLIMSAIRLQIWQPLEFMDPEMTEDERYYPDEETRDHFEVYKNLGLEMLGIYNELFLEFKMTIR